MVLNIEQAEYLLEHMQTGEVSITDSVYGDIDTLRKLAAIGKEMEPVKRDLNVQITELQADKLKLEGEKTKLQKELDKIRSEKGTVSQEIIEGLEEQNNMLLVENQALKGHVRVEKAKCKEYQENMERLQKLNDKKLQDIQEQYQRKVENLEKKIQLLQNEKVAVANEKKIHAQEWEKSHKRNWLLGTIIVSAMELVLLVAIVFIICHLQYDGSDISEFFKTPEFMAVWEKAYPMWFIGGGIIGLTILIAVEIGNRCKPRHES